MTWVRKHFKGFITSVVMSENNPRPGKINYAHTLNLRSHIGWKGERNILNKVWKPLPSRRVLKTLRGSTKRKAQRGQYLLAVGLGCYIKNGNFSLLIDRKERIKT